SVSEVTGAQTTDSGRRGKRRFVWGRGRNERRFVRGRGGFVWGRGRNDPQLRGTSFQGTDLSTRGSPGRPSTCSPRMLRMISDVPPSIELALTRRNEKRGAGH